MSKHTKAEREKAVEMLRKFVKPGDTIYTVLRHVSRSGMMRAIDAYVLIDSEPYYLSGYYATATNSNLHKHGGVRMDGCGMDMGFALAYDIGRLCFPDGGALEHSQREAQERRHGAEKETDGGYLINHRWM